MNNEIQDLAWSVLPKEFKEEVKRQYQIACDCNWYEVQCTLEYLFGLHNLTSDAEGEEILTCEKSKVQNYKRAIDEFLPKAFSNYDKGFWTGQKAAVDELFGSKCLLDNFDSLKQKSEAENNIDFEKLNKQLDAVLNSETKESLEEWIKIPNK